MRAKSAILVATALLCLVSAGCNSRQSVQQRMAAATFAIERYELDAASLELNNVLQEQPGNVAARLLLAQVSLAAGRAPMAERHLRAVLRLDPSAVAAGPLLARAMLAQGNFKALLAELDDTQQPTETPELAAYRGFAYLHIGLRERAEAQFQKALNVAPDLILARVGMARTALAQGRPRAAEAFLQETLTAQPFDILVHQTLGLVYFAQDRLAEAERAFSDAISLPVTLDASDAWLHAQIGLIETQWRVGKRARALIAVRELLEQFPSHPLPKYTRALLAYSDGDFKLASEYLRHVLHALPDHLPSKQLSAAADFAQGRLGSAQISLDGAELDGVADAGMARLLADTYLRMGNGSDAVATLFPFMTQESDAMTLDLFATANLYAGNVTASRRLMARALLQEPERLDRQIRYVAILLNAGDIEAADRMMGGWPTTMATEEARSLLRLLRYLRGGDFVRAEAYAKRRRRENPNDLHALLALAEVAEKSGQREQATGWLAIARERNPNALEPRFLLANYARRRGDDKELMAIAEELLTVQPFNAAALSLLGDAYLTSGDSAAAIATLREAARLAPTTDRNTIDLARAQLATGDFWAARQTIRDALARTELPLHSLTGLIVEEHQRGNDEQARALAFELQEYDAGSPVGFSIEGDLYMLEGDFEKASNAYEQAQRNGAGRTVAVKAFAAAIATPARDPAQPLSEWLKIAPNDRQIRRVIDALN